MSKDRQSKVSLYIRFKKLPFVASVNSPELPTRVYLMQISDHEPINMNKQGDCSRTYHATRNPFRLLEAANLDLPLSFRGD
jgi:hypothetical protein